MTLSVFIQPLPAAQLDLMATTIDCGGTSLATAGTLSMSVTVGQSEGSSASLTAGSLTMTLGFQPITEVEPPPPPPQCEGDANGDGIVDPLDTGFVITRFACAVGTGDVECDAADQNDDGEVDPLDAGYVMARFGECP